MVTRAERTRSTSEVKMKAALFSLAFSKVLAVLLCLSLILPVEAASEPSTTFNGRTDTTVSPSEVNKAAGDPAERRPATLSPEEVEELAKRAEEPGANVVGGALSNLHLTYIVIALAAAVIVLVLK
jgi:hypothetical protein